MPDIYPPYIFGMHDRGGEQAHARQNKPAGCSSKVSADPNN